MSADSDKSSPSSYEQKLSLLDDRLRGNDDDKAMLADVGAAMRAMLAENGESEVDIRTTLQKKFASGDMRRETFELVSNLLGKISSEEMVRAATSQTEPDADEIFAKTAVIEEQAEAQIQAHAAINAQAKAQAPQETDVPAAKLHAQVKNVTVGSVLRDRYLLKEELAEGSMGVVYKALDRRLAEAGEGNSYVAIKVLSPKLSRNAPALRALQQEAAKGRCLAHPNIVRFIDLDRDGEFYFLVMEWLEGRSLARILDDNRGNALDVDTALDIVRQAGRALDYAHQRGVIHADVKPGNIMVTPDGTVKLIDFGVARVRQKESEGKARNDQAVAETGTPAYSSMQVLTGEDPVAADDVFSLACLLYRIVAGYRVFGPRNAAQAAEDGMEPQRPQQLDGSLWPPLKKALSYSRVTRFASPKEFVSALNSAAGSVPRTAPPVATPEQVDVEVPDIRAEALSMSQRDARPTDPLQSDEVNTDSVDTDEVDFELPRELPQPSRSHVGPIRADNSSIMYEPEDDEAPGRSFWGIAIFAVFAAGLGYIATQTDLVDQIGEAVETLDVAPLADVLRDEGEIIDAPVVDEAAQDIAEFQAEKPQPGDAVPVATDEVSDAPAEGEPVTAAEPGAIGDELVQDAGIAIENETALVDVPPAIDWSSLPAPDIVVTLAGENSAASSIELTIREDNGPAIIDFIRDDVTGVLTLVLSETDFSGSGSPLEAGLYTIENGGELTFEIGQDRARTEISMRSNPVREADRDVSLQARAATAEDSVLATIQLTLEDDDQRAFEASLPPNTVAFAVSQISVQESDPAAQIDVVRYRADNTTLEVPYELVDVTASEGQDYFAPAIGVVEFAPGQRTARILIPLGQDARPEDDEAFMLELQDQTAPAEARLFSQIAVMIRDDDT